MRQRTDETAGGAVFTGKVRTLLNGREDIDLLIEWDPILQSETEIIPEGHVVGY
ncbi:MAG: hypothetical protein K5629_02900 [Eubacteriales bacterium]|nr:hypothetical protein [Eubacteriales bacterium]